MNTGPPNGTYGSRPPGHVGASPAPPQMTAAPDRRGYSQPDRASPAPPIVVVSPDAMPDANIRNQAPGPERTSLGDVPRAGTITRLRGQTPRDTIPIIGKPPRKQRSSRFVPSEKVEIERLPPFGGELYRDYLGDTIFSNFASMQRHRPKSEQSFSSGNCASAGSFSISTMPALSSRASRSKRRRSRRC